MSSRAAGGLGDMSIDDYLAAQPDEVRPILQRIREAIHAGLPGAEERVRYGMPAVMLDDRYALHFAGWKKHVGLYPVSPLPAELEAEVAPYRSAKDTVKLMYADPIPYDLVQRIAAELGAMRRARSG